MRDPRKPDADLIDEVEALRARLAELEDEREVRQRAEEDLQTLVAGTASTVGEAFFTALAHHLSSALDVRYVYITKVRGEDPLELCTLAVWHDGALGDNFDYSAAKTPCEMVARRGTFYCEHGVQTQFPHDPDLAAMGAVSYLGARIDDSAGKALGHLCVLDDKPLSEPERALSIMRMFATRAATELERVRAEAQRSMMLTELDHRVKNNLAVVLSIAEQTLESSGTLEEFAPAFLGRIHAMAIAHEMLARERWAGAELRQLVERSLEPHQRDRADRITLEGEPLMLPSHVAPPLSMVLHELITNAAKHGALSVPAGTVSIRWTVDATDGGARRLRLGWRERHGPPVAPDARRGLGTELIEKMIPYQCLGRCELAFDRDGVRCDLEVPLDLVVPSGATRRARPPGAEP